MSTTSTCILTMVGSSKVRSGSASVHSRTNQPRRPNEMFWNWNAPSGSKVPLVLKVLKSFMTWTTWSIRHMRVRCALLHAQTSAWQPVNRSQSVEVDTDRFNNIHRSIKCCTQVVVVSAAEQPHAGHAENCKKQQRNGPACKLYVPSQCARHDSCI